MNNTVEKTEGTAGEIVLYQPDETITIEVRLDVEHDTVWLNTMQMSQLFNREDSNIRRHVGNIFREGELDKENNVHYLHVIGVKKSVPFYNLDVIISVGYRVHSTQGILFRRWVTSVLKDYLLHGCAFNRQMVALQQHLDDRLLKIEGRLDRQQEEIDFYIRTNQQPAVLESQSVRREASYAHGNGFADPSVRHRGRNVHRAVLESQSVCRDGLYVHRMSFCESLSWSE